MSTFDLQPIGYETINYRSNQQFDLNSKCTAFIIIVQAWSLPKVISETCHTRTTPTNIKQDEKCKNKLLKLPFCTNFVYHNIGQPIGELNLNLQIKKGSSKTTNLDVHLIHLVKSGPPGR